MDRWILLGNGRCSDLQVQGEMEEELQRKLVGRYIGMVSDKPVRHDRLQILLVWKEWVCKRLTAALAVRYILSPEGSGAWLDSGIGALFVFQIRDPD